MHDTNATTASGARVWELNTFLTVHLVTRRMARARRGLGPVPKVPNGSVLSRGCCHSAGVLVATFSSRKDLKHAIECYASGRQYSLIRMKCSTTPITVHRWKIS
jgi:hypothetical protein